MAGTHTMEDTKVSASSTRTTMESTTSNSRKKMEKALEKKAKQEIEGLHKVFVNWYKGLQPRDYLRQELLDRLIPTFSHVAPNGQYLQGRSTLIHNLMEKYGCYADTVFDIKVSKVKLIWTTQGMGLDGVGANDPSSLIAEHASDGANLCMVTYEEWHIWKEESGAMAKFGRLSSCLLKERSMNINGDTGSAGGASGSGHHSHVASLQQAQHNFHWVHVHETWLNDTGVSTAMEIIEGSENNDSAMLDISQSKGSVRSTSSSKRNALASSTATGWSSFSLTKKKPAQNAAQPPLGGDINGTNGAAAAAVTNEEGNVKRKSALDGLPSLDYDYNTPVPTAVETDPDTADVTNSTISHTSNHSHHNQKQAAAKGDNDKNPSTIVVPLTSGGAAGAGANNIAQQNALVTQQVQQQQHQIVQQRNVSLRRHFSPQLAEHAKPFMMGSELLGVSVNGWDIGTSQGPIGDEIWFKKALDNYEKLAQYKYDSNGNNSNSSMKPGVKRKLNLPEMVFPAAHVALEHREHNLWISWDVLDALDEWAKAHHYLPVGSTEDVSKNGVSVLQSEHAELWKQKNKHIISGNNNNTNNNNNTENINEYHYDWTYSSPFCGAVDGGKWQKLDASGMNVDLLKDKSQPILFFDEIVLYEDDLHDNGQVQFSIKIRVMPTCAFLLARMWVRIDRVLLRLRETRILIQFGEKESNENSSDDDGPAQQPNAPKSALKRTRKYSGNPEDHAAALAEANNDAAVSANTSKSSTKYTATTGVDKIYRDVTWRECKWENLDNYKLPTNLKVWCREGNETPALASLLSRLPQVEPPANIYKHAVLNIKRPKSSSMSK